MKFHVFEMLRRVVWYKFSSARSS